MAAVRHLLRQRHAGPHAHAALALVPDGALLVHPVRAPERFRVVRREPDPQTPEAETLPPQFDRPPAHLVDVLESRQLKAHLVESPQLVGEPLVAGLNSKVGAERLADVLRDVLPRANRRQVHPMLLPRQWGCREDTSGGLEAPCARARRSCHADKRPSHEDRDE